MRVLVTSSAMAGHLGPLLAWVDALREARHDVVLLAPRAAHPRASRCRVPLLTGGSPDPARAAALWERFRLADPAEASVVANRELFGRLHTAAMLPGAVRAVEDHRPDLLLHEPTEYAGPVAALRSSVPTAQVAISAADVERGSLLTAAPALEEHGPVVPHLLSAPYLTRFPAAVDPSAYPDTRRYREPPAEAVPLPSWWGGSTDPLVLVTFGTVAGRLGAAPHRAALRALADLPVRVLVTTGDDLDLGPLPANAHAERWVDQHDVLAQAALVVCHGGSGTALAALAAGVPLVVHAMFADQPRNAEALERLGVARVVAAHGDTAQERAAGAAALVTALADAVTDALGPRVRERAAAVAADLASLPTPAEHLDALLGGA